MLFGKKGQKGAVQEKIRSGAFILDVRTRGEFAEGAYPGARNIPVQELPGRLSELGPKETPVVAYCASGARSAQAVRILKGAGFTDVSDGGGLGDMPR
jgi:phage shock protein E